ncbi:MAG: YgjV family protein [Pseudomonadaceae bacterium]|nr:YgjV family protein [Pseudomonadaceae bacterium]
MDVVHVLAQAIGGVAFVVSLIGPLCKDDRHLKMFGALSGAIWTLHFMLLGAWGGVAASAVRGSRFAASLWPQPVWVRWGFIFLPAVLGIWMVRQWVDALPVFATMLAGYGVFHWQGARLRAMFVGTSILWLVHNVIYMSYGGIVNDLINIGLHASMVWRLWRQKTSV